MSERSRSMMFQSAMLPAALWCGLLSIACGCEGPSAIAADGGPASETDAASPGTSTDAASTPGTFAGWTACDDLTIERAPRAPYAWSVSADGRWLALLDDPLSDSNTDSQGGFQSVALWNLPATALTSRLGSSDGPWLDVDLSPDGALVAVTGDSVLMRRTADGRLVWQHPSAADPPPDGWVRNLVFAPDGTQLASGHTYGIEFFRASDGASLSQLVSLALSPGLAFSADGGRLASSAPASWQLPDQTALWPQSIANTPPPLSLPPAGSGSVTDNWATFSPSGALLLSQSARNVLGPSAGGLVFDTQTQLFDAANGTLVHDWGSGLPRRPTFSPDGHWIVAGDQLINLDSGKRSSLGVPAAISVFLPDGRIAVADAGGDARLLCPF